MGTTRTVVTIDATAFAQFLEAQAVWAEGEAADREGHPLTRDYYVGLGDAYRGALKTFTEQVELGADGFMVTDPFPQGWNG